MKLREVDLFFMDSAPKDGTDILAYHINGKCFHPIRWNGEYWAMNWNREYRQQSVNYSGWTAMPEIIK